MKKFYHYLSILAISLLLTACSSSTIFETQNINMNTTPQQLTSDTDFTEGTQVLWGGVIVSSENLKQVTQFEVLAYPLDSDQRPDTDQTAVGRFIATKQGYLEINEYQQGKQISISGTLQELRTGSIGETTYTYPVITINQLHLWQKKVVNNEPQFRFGVGVRL
ncbi:MAG: Slp family lipoprotein [Psychromonas sp.]